MTGPPAAPRRYVLLDGLRGLAAVAVMLYHYAAAAGGGHLFAHAYLAVDFFFALSGFVLAAAYGRRLRAGASLRAFVLRRVIRFYPLVVPAVLAASALRLVRPAAGASPALLAGQAALNMLLLPFAPGRVGDHFPLLFPSWSLFFELWVNVAWAVLVPRLTGRRTVGLAALAGAALLAAMVAQGGIRSLQDTVPFGFARTAFSFLAGVLVFRWREAAGTARRAVPAWPSVLLLAALLAMPALGGGEVAFDAAAVLVAIPVLLRVAAGTPLSPRSAAVATALGDLSYPVYVLHVPTALLVALALGRLHLPPAAVGAAAAVLTLAGGWVALRWYDVPVRRWLTARLVGAPPPTVAATAP